jgi:hypothetical protein
MKPLFTDTDGNGVWYDQGATYNSGEPFTEDEAAESIPESVLADIGRAAYLWFDIAERGDMNAEHEAYLRLARAIDETA